ncbi:hypothetical protein FQN54_008163 [Arachnomyces sp. PD_36]|nr:hypothetical protein FQN54_008163 [Arachnomyces sp. PD_36]
MANLTSNQIKALRLEIQRISSTIESGAYNGAKAGFNRARTVIGTISSVPCTPQDPEQFRQQLLLIEALQHLAYVDHDHGGVKDIAEWCVQRWLRFQQSQPENWQVLQGLGNAWLLKSQAFLAKIHREEGKLPANKAQSDERLHNANYVEARGILQPSTEYFSRAVTTAERKGQLSGELLAQAAESFMSLGNVTYSNRNGQLFDQAVAYLRKAQKIPGYRLPPHLQECL